MSKPKVLFEASPMMDKHKTGVGYYTQQLITNLASNYPEEITLCGYFFDFLNHNDKKTPGIDHVSFVKIKYVPGKLLSLCRRLKVQPFLEVFVRRKADIVLYTNYVSLPTLNSSKNALVVYDLSFLDHPEYLQSVNLEYLKKFCPPSIKSADLIITISEFTKQRILHYFPNIKATIIITPIPPAPVTISPGYEISDRLIKVGVKSNQYILYLGTIEPRKNIQNLIKAYSLLPEAIRDKYALVLAGGKGWKDEEIRLEIASAKRAGCNIIETGYISDDEKLQLYAHSSCFVLPSHYEGFGMPILEAMQCKIPVLASDIPVFHEVAGTAARYFDKDSPADIAAAIEEVLSDSAIRENLITKGTARLDDSSWADNAKAVYTAFKELV